MGLSRQDINTITARANDTSVEPEKRAESYIVLASKDWDCSFKITELPTNKTTTLQPGNRAVVSYKKPKDPKDFETAKACVRRGLEEVETAIKLDPNSEAAWSYKTNLLLEASKLAEMDGDLTRKAELDKQREIAQKRTNQLSEANRTRQMGAAFFHDEDMRQGGKLPLQIEQAADADRVFDKRRPAFRVGEHFQQHAVGHCRCNHYVREPSGQGR